MTPEAVGFDWQALGMALALLLAAAALLVLEFFVVSMGLISLLSIGCAGGAVYLAFGASPVAGWAVLGAIPVLGFYLVRWGLRRIGSSPLVVREAVEAEAGYHHTLDAIGVRVGSLGQMVTPGRPSGRARFEAGECDVQVRSGTLERGQMVRVEDIDGPVVQVSVVDQTDAAVPAPPPGIEGEARP